MSRSFLPRFRKRRRRVVVIALASALAFGAATPALAAWSSSGSGEAAAGASTMPGGNTPTVSVSGNNVTVRWPTATFPNGVAVEGYTVRRYDASTGQAATVGPACAGIVSSTMCTESSVPAGNWVYTETPVQGGWTGAESSPSTTATVG